jgi:hypothetical protein
MGQVLEPDKALVQSMVSSANRHCAEALGVTPVQSARMLCDGLADAHRSFRRELARTFAAYLGKLDGRVVAAYVFDAATDQLPTASLNMVLWVEHTSSALDAAIDWLNAEVSSSYRQLLGLCSESPDRLVSVQMAETLEVRSGRGVGALINPPGPCVHQVWSRTA